MDIHKYCPCLSVCDVKAKAWWTYTSIVDAFGGGTGGSLAYQLLFDTKPLSEFGFYKALLFWGFNNRGKLEKDVTFAIGLGNREGFFFLGQFASSLQHWQAKVDYQCYCVSFLFCTNTSVPMAMPCIIKSMNCNLLPPKIISYHVDFVF